MNKLLTILVSLCLLLTLASCAGKPTPATDGTTAAPQPAASDETMTDAGETGTDATEAGTNATEEGTDAPKGPANTEETDANETTAEEPDAAPAQISLRWSQDFDRDLEALTACNAVDDPQTAFVISTDRAVSGLRILSLYEASFSDDGHYTFSHDAVYSQDTLTPDAPLVVNATFYGDTPNIGIRYIDTDGSEKLYAIDVSGMDGSLYLLSFEGGGAG